MSFARRVLGGLFVLSLGLNLILAWKFWHQAEPRADSVAAQSSEMSSADGRASGPGSPANAGSELPTAHATPAAAADLPRRVRDALRAAGLEDEAIRPLVEQWLWRRRNSARGAPAPWWQASSLSSELNFAAPADLKAVRQEMVALFGEPPPRSARLDFLPEAKRREVTRILRDYEALSADLQAEANGFSMPEDQKRMTLLKEEMEKDLRSVLEPGEYEELTLLQSTAGQRAQLIAQQLALDEPTFREVLRLRREAEARLAAIPSPTVAQTNANEARFQAKLEALVGADELRKKHLLNSTDAKVLRRAQRRLAFDETTFEHVLAQREQAVATIERVTATAAPAEEKRSALKAEAARVKAEVARILGPEAAEAYFMQNGMSWLHDLERGQGVRFTEQGWPESFPVR